MNLPPFLDLILRLPNIPPSWSYTPIYYSENEIRFLTKINRFFEISDRGKNVGLVYLANSFPTSI